MRRKTVTVGVLLILGAILLFQQGAQILTPLADISGLSSHYTEETVILPPTLYSISASSNSSVSEDLPSGSQIIGSLQVAEGRDVAFYVMDAGNFSLWSTRRPSATVLAEPTAVSYNFTMSPNAAGTYYFVFDNQNNSPRTVIFSLSSVQTVTVLNPLVQYANFEILLVGLVLSYLGLKGGKSKPEPSPVVKKTRTSAPSWKCKFCGALNEEKRVFCVKCGRSQS
jgi:hypothetical protein